MTHALTRRAWWIAAGMLAASSALARRSPRRMIDLIEVPNNLGLRPPSPGVEPGTWRAPAVLEAAGLSARLQPARHARLPRPTYAFDAVPGTRMRNGHALRALSLALATEVQGSFQRGAMPVVIGGDCSNLLGCLVALRRVGGRGVVHVDGHSDFFHPGNYDATARLGTAAGMDLALATGRGESILTAWPEVTGALVDDRDAIQIGEREVGSYPGFAETGIVQTSVQQIHASGVAATVTRAVRRLAERGIDRAWLHLDLDVLDQAVMPAVDSPGSPGLTYDELTRLVRGLVGSGRIAGIDVAIYDPDLDRDGKHAANIVACIAAIFAP